LLFLYFFLALTYYREIVKISTFILLYFLLLYFLNHVKDLLYKRFFLFTIYLIYNWQLDCTIVYWFVIVLNLIFSGVSFIYHIVVSQPFLLIPLVRLTLFSLLSFTKCCINSFSLE